MIWGNLDRELQVLFQERICGPMTEKTILTFLEGPILVSLLVIIYFWYLDLPRFTTRYLFNLFLTVEVC